MPYPAFSTLALYSRSVSELVQKYWYTRRIHCGESILDGFYDCVGNFDFDAFEGGEGTGTGTGTIREEAEGLLPGGGAMAPAVATAAAELAPSPSTGGMTPSHLVVAGSGGGGGGGVSGGSTGRSFGSGHRQPRSRPTSSTRSGHGRTESSRELPILNIIESEMVYCSSSVDEMDERELLLVDRRKDEKLVALGKQAESLTS